MKNKGELNMNSKQPHMVEAVSTLSVKELMANQDDSDRRSDYSLDQSVTPPPAYSRGSGVTATTKLIMATVIIVSVILGACIVAAAYAARQTHCQCPSSQFTASSSPLLSPATGDGNAEDQLQEAAIAESVREANAAFAAFAERLSAGAPSSAVVENEEEVKGEQQPAPSAAENKDDQEAAKRDESAQSDAKPEGKTDVEETKSDSTKSTENTTNSPADDKDQEGDSKKKGKKNKNRKGGKKNRRNKNKNRRRNKNKGDDDDDEDDESLASSGAAINTMGPVIFHLDDLARTILEHEEKAVVNCVMEKRNNRPQSLLLPFLTLDNNQQQTLKVFCRGGQDQPFGPMVAISATKESIAGPPLMGPAAGGSRPPFMMTYPGAPFNPNILASAMFGPLPPPFLRDAMGPGPAKRTNRKLNIVPRILDLFPPFPPQSSGERSQNIIGPQVRIVKKLPTDIEEAVLNVIEPLDLLFNEDSSPKAGPVFSIRRPILPVPEPKARIIPAEGVEDMPTPFEVEGSVPAGPHSVPPHRQQEQPEQIRPISNTNVPPQPPTEPQLVARRPFTPGPVPPPRFPFNLLNGRRPNFLAGLFPPPAPAPRPEEHESPDAAEEQPEERQRPGDDEEESENGPGGNQGVRFMMGPGPNFHFNRPEMHIMGGPRGAPLRERFLGMQHETHRRQLGNGEGPGVERPERYNGPGNDEEDNDGEVNHEHEEHEIAFHHVRRGGPMRMMHGRNQQDRNNEEEEEFDPFLSSVSDVMQPPPLPRQFARAAEEDDDWSEPTAGEHGAHPHPRFIQPRSLRRQNQQGPGMHRQF